MTVKLCCRSILSLAVSIMAAGCVDIKGPLPDPVPAEDVFSEFRFTTEVMLIKPGDTLQTGFIATSMAGTPIPVDLSKVTWISQDSARVFIDSMGRVTANVLSNNPVEVNAVYEHGTTVRKASLQVYVRDNDIVATSVKMVALDSVRVGYTTTLLPLPRIRLDMYNGDIPVLNDIQIPLVLPVPYAATYIANGGPDKEPVYFVANNGLGIGRFWIMASVNLYGNEVKDSLEFTGTYPTINGGLANFSMDEGGNVALGSSARMVLQPCGFTLMINLTPEPIEMVFNDSLAPTSDCTPSQLPEDVRKQLQFFPSITVTDQVGGNMILPPISVNVRRSATQGIVTWYARDPATKERLPFSGQYPSIHVE